MKKTLLPAALGAALLSSTALAEDEPGFTFSGSVAITNNYIFRGVTQSLNDSEGQFSARLDHSDGYYFGIFLSGVNFGDGDTGAELDLYGGYAFALDEGLTLDISATYYAYPGSSFDDLYNFFEVGAALTYDFEVASVALKAAISPDFFGNSGTGFWLGGGVGVPVTEWLSLSANAGYQWVDDNAAFALPDYAHYDIGATITFHRFALDLRYVDNDLDGSDEQYVATLTFAFP